MSPIDGVNGAAAICLRILWQFEGFSAEIGCRTALRCHLAQCEPRELLLDQLRCGAAIAAANGHPPSESFMKLWEETFSQRDPQYATSMLRDVERCGQTEVEHILGFMLNKAVEANIAHRTLLLAYTHIKAFERRRSDGGSASSSRPNRRMNRLTAPS